MSVQALTAVEATEVVKRRKKGPPAPPRKPTKEQQAARANHYAGQISALGRPSNGEVDAILDALAVSPNWSWDEFLEQIHRAQEKLGRLTEKVEERASRGAEA